MGYVINFGKKRLEKFCSRQNSAAQNIEERNLRIENLEIKVWTQNFRIKNKQKTKNGENSDTSRYGSTKYTRLTNHPDQQCYGKSSKYCFINLHNEHAQQMAQPIRRRYGTSANSKTWHQPATQCL